MFKLNKEAANSFDSKGAFINNAGKYIGQFTRVEVIDKRTESAGSLGLGISFISNEKQEAAFYLNLMYEGTKENAGGMQTLNALLACLKLRESGDAVPTIVKKYNKDTKKNEDAQVPCLVHLMNKPIGLVLQMKFDKDSTSEYPKPIIYSVFEAGTELLASEILASKTTPEKLAKVVEYIASKPLIDSRKGVPTPPAKKGDGKTSPMPDDLDSDIPF